MNYKNYLQFLFLSCFLSISYLAHAQKKYGNEWITYGKPYFKFHTPSEDHERGWTHIYRRDMFYTLDYTTIKNSGFPIDATDPRHIQIFTDGEETAIQIMGEEDGVFDVGDYILIYSEHNDTRMDESLFKSKDHIPMNMTMHSFQKAHFLTYTTDGTLGKRVQKISLTNNAQAPENAHNNRLSSNLLKTNVEQVNPWVSNSYHYGFNNLCYGAVYPTDRIRSRLDIESLGGGWGRLISFKNETRKYYWRENTTFLSHFNEGKGYIGQATAVGVTRTQEFDLQGITNPQIRIKVRIIGLLNTPHHVRVVLEDEDGTEVTLGDMLFNNYEISTLENTINSLNLTKIKPKLKVKLTAIQADGSTSGATQREDWASIETEIYYDQDFGTTGSFWGEKYYGLLHGNIAPQAENWYSTNQIIDKYFTLKPNASGTAKIELDHLPATAVLYDITDVNTLKIIEPSGTNGTKQVFLIPDTQTERKLYVSNYRHAVGKVYGEQTYEAVNINANYLIIYNDLREEPAAIKTQYRYTDAVQQYADYRASAEGGGYVVQMSDVEDLFDIFSYGQRTSLALRKFADYMLSHGVKPQALFLIGKGIEYMSEDTFYWNDLPPMQHHVRWINKPCLVPSMGSPSSDNEITAGLAGFPDHVPAIPTGRLSTAHYAKTEVLNYLDKVKAHDAMSYDAAWAKNMLHMSGGFNDSELQLFKSYTDHFTHYSENNYLNSNVLSIQKATSTGLSAAQRQQVWDKINEGTLLLTMFGHSSATSSDGDLNIGDPITSNVFANKDKYPMIVMNGCQSGQIFEGRNIELTYRYNPQDYTMGEKWITAKDKGAVLFWSHSQLGYTATLYSHTANFYETLADKNFITRTVGEIIQETCRKSMERNGRNAIAVINVQQFTLQGDPVLRLFKQKDPDYYVDNSRISMVEPNAKKITTHDSRFALAIDASNLGMVDMTSLEVLVERTLPNGTTIKYPIQRFDYVDGRRTLQFEIEQESNVTDFAFGNNTFKITLDPNNTIKEINENNNTAEFSYYFHEQDLIPLSPAPYAIVHQTFLKLIAQRTNSKNTSQADYLFELDKVGDFANPIKDTVLTGTTIPTWETNLPDQTENTVWYWRARNLDNPDESFYWASASFVYAPSDSAGWSQGHQYQFQESTFENIAYDKTNATWSFISATNPQATLTSSLIGTATYWDKLIWQIDPADATADEWRLEIIGVKTDQTESVLFTSVTPDNQEINPITGGRFIFDLSNRIDINQYPFLRLKLYTKDTDQKTPIPLKMWRITYKEVPELVIIPPDETDTPDEVTEGETATQTVTVLNLGGNTGGTVVIKYIVTNKDTGEKTVIYDTLQVPNAGDTLKVDIDIPTEGLGEGENDVEVIINPSDTVVINPPDSTNLGGGNAGGSGGSPVFYPTPEQDLTNNNLTFTIIIKSDKINPMMDVLFDGRYLMDGDIISPNPVISIDLEDNSRKNKLLDAQSHLEMHLSRCETCPFERIDLGSSDSISWSVTENNNRLTVNYTPKKLPDGIYTLKVQGTDASGNQSGIEPYQISFQVVNKTMVSHFYPYPNPVMDKTQFIFTLTGDVPDDMRIRIMTSSGKVVRTITQQELGNIHVGHNISEFMWDGTDEYGDKLANGVYLYRVDIKSAKDFGIWNTAGDKFFKKGYGKIYLMR